MDVKPASPILLQSELGMLIHYRPKEGERHLIQVDIYCLFKVSKMYLSLAYSLFNTRHRYVGSVFPRKGTYMELFKSIDKFIVY